VPMSRAAHAAIRSSTPTPSMRGPMLFAQREQSTIRVGQQDDDESQRGQDAPRQPRSRHIEDSVARSLIPPPRTRPLRIRPTSCANSCWIVPDSGSRYADDAHEPPA
jgi:hypothetical protein